MTILLIDADELLHSTLAALEVETDWGNDVWTLSVNATQAEKAILDRFDNYRDLFPDHTRSIMAFTGPGENWRKKLLPTYKGNRLKTRKPMLFAHLKQEALEGRLFPEEVACVSRATLEADDTLGILATKPQNAGKTVIVSQDKDFLGVPGRLLRQDEVLTVSPAEAARWHLTQALMGDRVDGYFGCPGVGLDTAQNVLSKGLKYVPTTRYLKRGKNQGQEVTEWELAAAGSPWETVVSCYEKAGLSEADALVQARVARILQWSDWDSTKQEVRLWQP